MKSSSKVLLSSTATYKPEQPTQKLIELNYRCFSRYFTVWLDYSKQGAIKFKYNAQRDTGNFKLSSQFHLEYLKAAIKASNTMTNILPQVANINCEAWIVTEEV